MVFGLTGRALAALGWSVGAAALAAALIAQYGFEMLPCQLCMWQRYPYAPGLAFGALGFFLTGGAARAAWALAALSFAASFGIAVFHSGVELDWWDGLQSCAGAPPPAGLSPAEMIDWLNKPKPSCDLREEFLFGLSMTNWNALVCADIAALFGFAAYAGQPKSA